MFYCDAEGRLLGRSMDGKVKETSDPGFQSFAWPLNVGKSWTHTFQFEDHASGRSFDTVQFWSKVGAYEEVTTSAGTFKAFRIVHDNPSTHAITWWSPELGIIVKSRTERKSNYYAGPGTRETQLVSHDVRRSGAGKRWTPAELSGQ